jgi:DsbE subfamily thiol:disulfide oxidoreductase
MKKVMFGVSFIVILLGIMIFTNVIDNEAEEENGPNIYDVSGDTSVSGGMIAPKESVGIQPGETAPPFELETLEGETVALSEMKGEPVMLNFWATWCPPCREEMPEMQKFFDEYQDEINVIAVNYNEENDKVMDYLNEYGYTFPSPLDPDAEVGNEYGVLTLPTTYFINSDGVIQEPRHVGPMDYEFMEDMLETLN